MPVFVILRQGQADRSGFDTVRTAVRQNRLWNPGDGEIQEWVALSKGAIGGESFSSAAKFLSAAVAEHGGVTALVDEIDARRLDPLAANGWSSLITMLILAFPEVRWHFLIIRGRLAPLPNGIGSVQTHVQQPESVWALLNRSHGISCLFEQRGTPLFDGYGLRQLIRTELRLNDPPASKGQDLIPPPAIESVPQRPKLAVVLDEEAGFSEFCAYTAYQAGFRVHAISSWEEATSLLGQGGPLVSPRPDGSEGETSFPANDFLLSIEDWYLNFPDQSRRSMSRLDVRERILPALSRSSPSRRRFVTVGHEQNAYRKLERDEYLTQLRRAETASTGVKLCRTRQKALKPASGIYTLWKELGLDRTFQDPGVPRFYRGLAPGYHWPPPPPMPDQAEHGDEQGASHSSPGKLLQIAEHLIDRVTEELDRVGTVHEAIRCAILASQALELLGCKTPTLSVAALALKHEFEIMAECQFVGVEYHLSMVERLKDLEKNLEAMSRWLHPRRRREFCLNNEAKILSRLIATLDKHGEFEESETCRIRLRTLHRQINLIYDFRRLKLLRLLLAPVNLYIDVVLRSLAHYVAVIMAFFLAASLAYFWFESSGEKKTLDQAMFCVLRYMVCELPESPPKNLMQNVIMYHCVVFGVLNFGVIVSHLYGRMVRK